MSAPHPSDEPAGLRSVVITLGALLALVSIPYAVPKLGRLRLLTPIPPGQGLSLAAPPPENTAVGETVLPPMSAPDETVLAQPEDAPLPAKAASLPDLPRAERPPVSIVDPTGRSLDPFYQVLDRVAAREPGVIARVAMLGDSNIASDLVSSVLRRKLQAELGEGGHGFVMITRPDTRYFHNDVRMPAASGWATSTLKGPLAPDGLYGVGGATFRATGPGAFALFSTTTTGTFGREVSRFGVEYLEQPEGDPFLLYVDDKLVRTVETRGPTIRSRSIVVDVPLGHHTLKLEARGAKVRAFGAWLERERGVVVDALGVTGSKLRYLERIDEAHLAEFFERRPAHLVAFNFGVNESREGHAIFGTPEAYADTMRRVIKRVRRASGGAPCLVISPNDIAQRVGDSRPSFPLLAVVAGIQARVAPEEGCAFWDLHKAMGGEGSMGKWLNAGLGAEDMLHPSFGGAQLLGSWLYHAVLEHYSAYRARRATSAPSPERPPSPEKPPAR